MVKLDYFIFGLCDEQNTASLQNHFGTRENRRQSIRFDSQGMIHLSRANVTQQNTFVDYSWPFGSGFITNVDHIGARTVCEATNQTNLSRKKNHVQFLRNGVCVFKIFSLRVNCITFVRNSLGITM